VLDTWEAVAAGEATTLQGQGLKFHEMRMAAL
jgi:hypothetical protein